MCPGLWSCSKTIPVTGPVTSVQLRPTLRGITSSLAEAAGNSEEELITWVKKEPVSVLEHCWCRIAPRCFLACHLFPLMAAHVLL